MTVETRRDLMVGLAGVALCTALVAVRVFWMGAPPPTAAGLPGWAAVPGVAVVGSAIVGGLAVGLERASSRAEAWILAIAAVFLAVLGWTRLFAVEPTVPLGSVAAVSGIAGALLGEGLWWRRRGDRGEEVRDD